MSEATADGHLCTLRSTPAWWLLRYNLGGSNKELEWPPDTWADEEGRPACRRNRAKTPALVSFVYPFKILGSKVPYKQLGRRSRRFSHTSDKPSAAPLRSTSKNSSYVSSLCGCCNKYGINSSSQNKWRTCSQVPESLRSHALDAHGRMHDTLLQEWHQLLQSTVARPQALKSGARTHRRRTCHLRLKCLLPRCTMTTHL